MGNTQNKKEHKTQDCIHNHSRRDAWVHISSTEPQNSEITQLTLPTNTERASTSSLLAWFAAALEDSTHIPEWRLINTWWNYYKEEITQNAFSLYPCIKFLISNLLETMKAMSICRPSNTINKQTANQYQHRLHCHTTNVMSWLVQARK